VIIATVARKELRELFRDLRSVALSIGVPLVLFPLLFLALDGTLELQRAEGSRIAAVLAVEAGTDPGNSVAAIAAGYTVIPAEPVAAVRAGDAAVGIDRDGRIVYNDRSEISTAAAAQLQADLAGAGARDGTVEAEAEAAAAAADTAAAAASAAGADAGAEGAARPGAAEAAASETAEAVGPAAEAEAAAADTAAAAASAAGAEGPARPGAAAPREVRRVHESPGAAAGETGPRGILPARRLSIASAAAIFVLLAALVSLLPAALEIGAGEKQRQSLELLLGATGRRGELVLGKLLAVVVTGAIGVAAFLGGVGLAVRLVPGLLDGAGHRQGVLALVLSGGVSPETLLTVLAASLTAVILIGVMELVISLVARSPREAQGLFLPLLLLVSVASYAAVLTDAWHAPGWFGWVPLLNVAAMIKGAILEAPPTVPVAVVVLENLAIAGILGALGGRILHSEWVLRRS
jgi:ABC-type Na+ efflux pump permease subunit